jgi:hypothetical protein
LRVNQQALLAAKKIGAANWFWKAENWVLRIVKTTFFKTVHDALTRTNDFTFAI